MNLDARLTRAEAATYLRISPATISMWKYREKITTDELGRYRLGDLLEVERATRRHPNSRRVLQLA